MKPPYIYVVMELCDKGSLMDVLSTEKLSLPQRLQMARDTALAVACMHEAGFVHRDIKSLNSFVADVGDETGEDTGVRLGDFGESVTFEAAEQEGPKMIGTAQW